MLKESEEQVIALRCPGRDTLREALLDGAVVIRRVSNGWLLMASDDYGEVVVEEVYSDADGGEVVTAASLAECLWSAFSGWMRSKRRGGLVIDVVERGFEED